MDLFWDWWVNYDDTIKRQILSWEDVSGERIRDTTTAVTAVRPPQHSPLPGVFSSGFTKSIPRVPRRASDGVVLGRSLTPVRTRLAFCLLCQSAVT